MPVRKSAVAAFVVVVLLLPLGATSSLAQQPDPWGLASINAPRAAQAPLGTAFTYQGHLTDGGVPAEGSYDFEFRLYNAASDGGQVGLALARDGVAVSAGKFTVQLDFGAHAFTGEGRWLEVGVRPGGSGGSYTTLVPRQPLTPAPYALALPGLRTEVNETSPNVIGGYHGNTVATGVYGATIGGGGMVNPDGEAGRPYSNQVDHNWATISGGVANAVTDEGGSVGGGGFNTASGYLATIGGGGGNTASGDYATISGGTTITASAGYATVGGGYRNIAGGTYATVGGGMHNTASSGVATVGGGAVNTASGGVATIGGGNGNIASGSAATIGGGAVNTASGGYATIGGGQRNRASGSAATVAGGQLNTASDQYATVGGGWFNSANDYAATVGGGEHNFASGALATVAGGMDNLAQGLLSFAAGRQAKANHTGAFVWADSTDADFASTGADQFLVRAGGGVGINTNAPMTNTLTVGGDGLRVAPDGTTFKRVQAGTATLGQAEDGPNTFTVAFPHPFSTTPAVIVTPRGQGTYDDVFVVTTREISTTAFKVNVYRVDLPGAGWAQDLQLDWLAWELAP